MKNNMVSFFAKHDYSSCKGCLRVGIEAPYVTVMDGNEGVTRVVCAAAADGFLETPYGVGLSMGC